MSVDIGQENQDDFAVDAAPEENAKEASNPLAGLSKVLGGAKKAAALAAEDQIVPVKKKKPAAKAEAPVDGKKMPAGPLVTVVTRNEYYRDGFRNMIYLAVFEAFIIVLLLVSFIFYMTTAKSQDRYFATTADGRIMQLVPLDLPNMTTAALMSWVAQATSEVMTFGYSDYQRRLQQSSRHFTHHGWETFTAALNQSHIIESMRASKQVLTAVPRSAPILKQEGAVNGKYRWIITLPLQVVYDGAGTAGRTDHLNLTLVIERVPSLENPNGVGIEQWIATQ